MKFELEKLREVKADEANAIIDRGGAVLNDHWYLWTFEDGRVHGELFYVLYDPSDPAHQLAEAIRRGGEYVDANGDAFYVRTLGRLYFDERDCFEFRAPLRPKPERKPAPARLTDCPTDGRLLRRRSDPELEYYFGAVGGELRRSPSRLAAVTLSMLNADDWEMRPHSGDWVSPNGWLEAGHG